MADTESHVLHPLPPFAFQPLQHFASAHMPLPVRARSCSIDKSIACSAQENLLLSAKHNSLSELLHIHVPPTLLGELNSAVENNFVSKPNQIMLAHNPLSTFPSNSVNNALPENGLVSELCSACECNSAPNNVEITDSRNSALGLFTDFVEKVSSVPEIENFQPVIFGKRKPMLAPSVELFLMFGSQRNPHPQYQNQNVHGFRSSDARGNFNENGNGTVIVDDQNDNVVGQFRYRDNPREPYSTDPANFANAGIGQPLGPPANANMRYGQGFVPQPATSARRQISDGSISPTSIPAHQQRPQATQKTVANRPPVQMPPPSSHTNPQPAVPLNANKQGSAGNPGRQAQPAQVALPLVPQARK